MDNQTSPETPQKKWITLGVLALFLVVGIAAFFYALSQMKSLEMQVRTQSMKIDSLNLEIQERDKKIKQNEDNLKAQARHAEQSVKQATKPAKRPKKRK